MNNHRANPARLRVAIRRAFARAFWLAAMSGAVAAIFLFSIAILLEDTK